MITNSVHPNEFLGYMHATSKELKDGWPVTYDSKPHFEYYGLGCFLLTGAELYKMKW